MNSFIVFPTTSFIYKAALVCNQEGLSIDHIYITSRHNVYEKINAVLKQYDTQHFFVFAPFAYDESIQASLESISKKNIMIEWYGESKQLAFSKLKKHKKIKTHSAGKIPKPPSDIEKYLKYKKTLTFLGDGDGNLAIDHLKEAIMQLSKSPIIPKVEEQVVSAFAETDFPAIEGRTRRMIKLKKDIIRVSAASLNKILLLGETGTGKEAAAFFLHALDPCRRKGKFDSINCAVLQEELLISELFGHEKGAFTGATKRKEGLVSKLNNGTLFLDELPDLTPRVQAMLLRFLESGTYTPLGSTEPKNADTKIISAAQKSRLIEKINTKEFRQDLYYRIAGKTITLPSLNEIPEDIPVLIVHLAYKIEEDFEKRDQAISYFLEHIEKLQKHSWPGNVRELANYITRRIKLGNEEHIDLGEHSLFLEQSPEASIYDSPKSQQDKITLNHIKKDVPIDASTINTIDTVKKSYARNVYQLLTSQRVSQNQVSKLLGISVNTLKKLLVDD